MDVSTPYFVELRDGIARTVRANLAASDALAIARTEPDAAARWLRGEPVFTEAETLLRG
jgi:hypothetical protein